jgi:luciferase family oxidoreductase group 1
MIPLSVLDLAPIVQGSTAAIAFRNSLALAQHAEQLGYSRFWLAEHHSMPGIASAATSVVIAHVAGGTQTIRVGAGGIMLPNHSPLLIAEQFGTLASLHPGRIDLGLGRAPGSDQATMRALRRTPEAADSFPRDVAELMAYFEPAKPGQLVQAVPGAGLDVPIWILGSSLFGAHFAANMGLPFAFASHFAPAMMMEAVDIYRSQFRPSARLERPYVMLGLNVFAADTEEDAHRSFTSLQQAFVNLRRGRPTQLQPPDDQFDAQITPLERSMLESALGATLLGTPAQIETGLRTFIDYTGADEIMVASQIYDFNARLRSYEIVAQAGIAKPI